MTSEPENFKDAIKLDDEGLLRVHSFLYVLRNEAGHAAEKLRDEINRMESALADAYKVYHRLEYLADSAEEAAEREGRNV